MTHELDRSRWYGGPEPDHVRIDDPADSEIGAMTARWIGYWLEKNNISLPDDAKYVGLAAGQAYPEMQLAHLINIHPSNITLVDRVFRPVARSRFKNEFPEVQAIDNGMFEFLEHPPRTDYSIITALGIEYALEEPDVVQAFISKVAKVLRPGGIVTVFPYTGEDPTTWWESNGFTPLFEGSTTYSGSASFLMYSYEGNNQ